MPSIPELLTAARRHHQAGELQAAEQILRQIVHDEPNQVHALFFLAGLAYQAGNYASAADAMGRAIAIHPHVAEFHNNLGLAWQALQKADEAIACYQQALRLKPGYAEALNNLGAAFASQGKLDEAVACYRRTLSLQPEYAEAHYNLGNAWILQGKLDEAAACYRSAIRCNPRYAEAYGNLGSALRDTGRLDEAIVCYRRAVEIRPDLAQAHDHLGTALREKGLIDEAVGCYRQALALRPESAEAHHNLACAVKEQGHLDEALACYGRALQVRADYADAHYNLASLFREQGQTEEAALHYRRARELQAAAAGTPLHAHDLRTLRVATLCPPVMESNAAIDAYRERLRDELQGVAQAGIQMTLAELSFAGVEPPFNLHYHGRDNRPIKEAWAAAFRGVFPQVVPRGGTPGRRIGLVVTGRHEPIFLHWWQLILQRIDCRRFELTVLCSRAAAASIRAATPADKVRLLTLPPHFDRAVETIRSQRFAVLYYWEVGSDPMNYFLPFCRLAPVQVTSWGVQVTSGIAEIDYYLSCALLEPPGAQSHYTEKLILAETLLAYHHRPRLPESPKPRAAFGIAAAQHLYLCAQNLRKIHPDFDPLLAQILQRDPRGVLVLVESPNRHVAEKLRDRFRGTVPGVYPRIVFLPRQSYDDYLSLVSAADVLLDPLYYNSGTTGYDGLLLGKPIVTLPWRFQIGRSVLACYRKMGIAGCVARDADDYVRLAVALGTDADYRETVGREIAAASPELLEDMAAVREYEQVFGRLVEEARGR